MAVSQALRIQRVALSAGVRTPVRPPAAARQVSIGNGTSGDVTVYTNEDESEFLAIATGYERLFGIDRSTIFSPYEVAFWLKAASSGTAVLLWM